MLLEVRVSVEVRNNTSFYELEQRRRSKQDEPQASRRPQAKCTVIKLVEERRNSPTCLLHRRDAVWEGVWHTDFNLVLVIDSLRAGGLSGERKRPDDLHSPAGRGLKPQAWIPEEQVLDLPPHKAVADRVSYGRSRVGAECESEAPLVN